MTIERIIAIAALQRAERRIMETINKATVNGRLEQVAHLRSEWTSIKTMICQQQSE